MGDRSNTTAMVEATMMSYDGREISSRDNDGMDNDGGGLTRRG